MSGSEGRDLFREAAEVLGPKYVELVDALEVYAATHPPATAAEAAEMARQLGFTQEESVWAVQRIVREFQRLQMQMVHGNCPFFGNRQTTTSVLVFIWSGYLSPLAEMGAVDNFTKKCREFWSRFEIEMPTCGLLDVEVMLVPKKICPIVVIGGSSAPHQWERKRLEQLAGAMCTVLQCFIPNEKAVCVLRPSMMVSGVWRNELLPLN